MAELEQDKHLGSQLIQLLGLRECAPRAAAQAALDRRRVYTLVFRAYDQVRKTVAYLCWEQGDAETVAPSFRSGKGTRRLKGLPGVELPPDNSSSTITSTVASSPTAPDDQVPAGTSRKPVNGGPFLH